MAGGRGVFGSIRVLPRWSGYAASRFVALASVCFNKVSSCCFDVNGGGVVRGGSLCGSLCSVPT